MRWHVVIGAALAVLAACGARTALNAPPLHSNLFCARATYDSGFSDVSLYFLLDRSGSMDDDQKWTSATAALSAFVNDSAESGVGVGIDFFPPTSGDQCNPDTYAQPPVPIALLPGVATKVTNALASTSPGFGPTPLPVALRGGVEYARGVRLADPTRDVAVAVITDGLPEGCGVSDIEATHQVEAAAADAFAAQPSILTFIIGLASGYVDKMNAMAAAGGTGKAILIDADPNTAQNIVAALDDLRDTIRKCRYSIPSVGDATVTPEDLSMSYRLSPTDPETQLQLYANAAACGTANGFVVDDPKAPKRVQLCPSTCAAVHAKTTSTVTVVAGCGAGAPDGGVHDSGGDGGTCPNETDVSCVASCTTKTGVAPECSFGEWSCPSGSIDATKCDCPPVPHGCCIGDGTYVDASCVNALWTCPPGATFFGESGCIPPLSCAPLLPCGPGAVCVHPDFSCGGSNVLGQCITPPASCPPDARVCGCDASAYASACAAESSGVDLSDSSNCSTPAGTFGCGPYFCASNQICKKTLDLVKTVAATSWACIDPPGGCSSGCGCKLCEPCPAGHSACKESCAGQTLTCTELP